MRVVSAARGGAIARARVPRLRVPPSPTVLLAVALVAGAAGVHLVLTPEHFREGLHFGLSFLATTAFQLWLAAALVLAPGPRVYRAGLWGSALVAATWMATRLVAPPGAPDPEPVEPWGVLATGLEVGAIVALASVLPSAGSPPSRRIRLAAALGVGAGFGALVLLASGAVTPIPPGRWTGPGFLLRPYPLPSWRLTGVWIVVAGRWSALVPWVTVGFLAAGSALVGRVVWLALGLPAAARAPLRRRGLAAALPAFLTAPVCCGAPVAAVAGGVAVGTLYRWTPALMGVSLALLSWNVVVLERWGRAERGGAEARG